MILVARPNHRANEERHIRHERKYSTAVRSSIDCPQKSERGLRRWTALVRRWRACAARRREEARAGGALRGRRRLRLAPVRSDLQDGGRPRAGERRSFVLAAHHVAAGECAVEDRDRPTDGGAGGWVLRKLPARAVLDHARHRRYLRHGARPSAALAVQRPLRRALLSADPHL